MQAALGQVALLTLGFVVANLTSLPWQQPAGQLVPINLSPGGASAPDRPLEPANSLARAAGRRPRSPAAVSREDGAPRRVGEKLCLPQPPGVAFLAVLKTILTFIV